MAAYIVNNADLCNRMVAEIRSFHSVETMLEMWVFCEKNNQTNKQTLHAIHDELSVKLQSYVF